jgi:hypothetical protein
MFLSWNDYSPLFAFTETGLYTSLRAISRLIEDIDALRGANKEK